MDNILKLDKVEKYNILYGLETTHPLVSIIDLSKATKIVNNIQMSYGVYALFLKDDKNCDIKYGRRTYDYQEGTIVSFAPGQVAEVNTIEDEVKPKVLGILFHPDLIRGTKLGRLINSYSFFSYSSNEALHISEDERHIIISCFSKIKAEIESSTDRHSIPLIVMNIELLLNYCLSCYERQFTSRKNENKDVLQRLESDFNDYFANNKSFKRKLPTVKYFADRVALSSNYFGDLVKKETGKSAQEYIQYKLIEHAKSCIVETNLTMSEIAYELGFQYPQHFGRWFKKRVGVTPNSYRK